MAGEKKVNSNLDVQGSIKATTVPNSTGTLVTFNSSTKVFGTRTNAQIFADIGLNTALADKEPVFTKNTGFNKNFGTTADTVAQGNDSRINNGQTAFGWGNFRDFGLGKSTLANTSDLDALASLPTQIFSSSPTSPTGNPTGFGYTSGIHIHRSASVVAQLAISSYNSDGMAFRRGSAATLQPWRYVWHDGNFDPATKENTFSKNTAFNKNFGTTANTVAQGNDSRFTDARTPTAHTHPTSQVTGLDAALAGKEPSFTKNTAFNKNFGTVANTVMQGNDSRAVNGQTAFNWGDHSVQGYIRDLSNYVDISTEYQSIDASKVFHKPLRMLDMTEHRLIGGFTPSTMLRKFTNIKACAYASGNVYGDLRVDIPVQTTTMWSMRVEIIEYNSVHNDNTKTTELLLTGYSTNNENLSVQCSNPDRISHVRFGRNTSNSSTVLMITPKSVFRYVKAYIKELIVHHTYSTSYENSSNYSIAVINSDADFLLSQTITNGEFIRDSSLVPLAGTTSVLPMSGDLRVVDTWNVINPSGSYMNLDETNAAIYGVTTLSLLCNYSSMVLSNGYVMISGQSNKSGLIGDQYFEYQKIDKNVYAQMGDVHKQVDITSSRALTDLDNGAILKIKANVTLTLNPSLAENFNFVARTFSGCSLNIKASGTAVLDSDGATLGPRKSMSCFRDANTTTFVLIGELT